ncbi:hypothetical protein PAAG_01447 [Paracoccidioides lutzii Pb01]|uniref:Uncharacterized protein n=1 Tax=Paracoccidioides lutzii (strain ATCC MYA-826 / Pb01) TaxID=502779 RepID=C1GSF2_PARBA|nr:hypothetical protein PAAG_01447 [Paracoccidioides lutzii Pb01]EEH38985.2 hypothetical protein PAAG_01447 [Paracoccidioides lutzii Pb01]
MECTRWPIRVQGNWNLPPEKPPEGARPSQDPAFIPDHFFVSPFHAPTAVACNDQERLSRAGMPKFDYRIESHCCKNYPSPLVDCQVSPARPEMRTITGSPWFGPNEYHNRRRGRSNRNGKEAQLHVAAEIAAIGATSLTLKIPPIVPPRFAELVGWWWEWWDSERTRLPHAGKPAEVHTHWVPRKTGLMLTACVHRVRDFRHWRRRPKRGE